MYLCETSFPALGCDDVSIAPIVRPNLILYQTRLGDTLLNLSLWLRQCWQLLGGVNLQTHRRCLTNHNRVGVLTNHQSHIGLEGRRALKRHESKQSVFERCWYGGLQKLTVLIIRGIFYIKAWNPILVAPPIEIINPRKSILSTL